MASLFPWAGIIQRAPLARIRRVELADRSSRECDDVDAIYLAVGSSCTISGLIVGVVEPGLGQSAFRSPDFRIHGVIIHHVFAAVQRHFDMHHRMTFLPLTIGHTIRETQGVARTGGPDVTEEALLVLANRCSCTQIRTSLESTAPTRTEAARQQDV